MRSHLLLAVLIIAPALSLAQTDPQTEADTPAGAKAAHSSVPSAGPSTAPIVDFITFKPDDFESRLFLDPGKITQETGDDIYHAVCAGCHMPDAKGAVGAGQYPALAGNENLVVGDYPVMVIVNGLGGMPPFRQVLDDQQIVAVVDYLQEAMTDSEVYPATVETVQQVRANAGPLPE